MIEYLLLTIIILAVAAYAVLGGADFGAGVWEVNNRLRSTEQDKKLIYRAIGPVWEANHVWLIFAITAVWTCYPAHFRQLCVAVSFPLAVALLGIVLRGASYAFRSTGLPGKENWEAVFALASTVTPFMFGCIIGVLSDDSLPRFSDHPNDAARYPLTDWISFQSLFFGFFAVGICSYLAAIFLVREAKSMEDRDLENTWRKRALLMSVLVGALSLAGLGVTALFFDAVWRGITQAAWPIVGCAILAGIVTIFALINRRYWLATTLAALAVTLVLLGWVIGQMHSGHLFGLTAGPPDSRTDNVRWLLFACMVVGILLITPPMIWLFYIFKKEAQAKDSAAAKK